MITKFIELELSEFQKAYISYTSREVQALFRALDKSIYDGTFSVSLVHWGKIIEAERLVRITYVLSNLGFCISSLRRNWAELQINQDKLYSYMSKEQVDSERKYYKFNKYTMRQDVKPYPSTLVKVGNQVKETGLTRKGFNAVSKLPFKLDVLKLTEYFEPIYQIVVKSITTAIENGKLKDPYFADKANYECITREVLDYYASYDGTYNLEYCLADSRGRAIYGALKRIANPISTKAIRALLIVPEPTLVTKFSRTKLFDIYLFVGELLGLDATTELELYRKGVQAYKRRQLPKLDLTDTDDRKDLHKLIWLERIYDKLDQLKARKCVKWDVPLEVDARMSINQFVGALTNDVRLLERTCVLGDQLQDPWHIEGVRRDSGKKVGTPVFYGSSQTARRLLKKAGISLIPEELKAINNEFRKGAFAVTKAFKDAIIGNYNHYAPSIQLRIWNDTFNVECNKFRTAALNIVTTIAWDTKANKARLSRTREPILIPDYRRFKLFWATCLIHNLDSQISNSKAEKFTSDGNWLITIHDADIALPGVCSRLRADYAKRLKDINRNRHTIINNFRESIGAVGHKADVSFFKVHKLTIQAPDVPFNISAMK